MTASAPSDDPVAPGLHASAAVVGETGVLVRGASGAGKTRLVLALVAAATRDGRFAALVADDRTLVSAAGGRVLARPHPGLAGLAERRGLGIVPVAHEPACVIGLVVDLVPGPVPRLPEPASRICDVAGLPLARLEIASGLATADAVALVLAALEASGSAAQGLAPFSLPSPPRCTR